MAVQLSVVAIVTEQKLSYHRMDPVAKDIQKWLAGQGVLPRMCNETESVSQYGAFWLAVVL